MTDGAKPGERLTVRLVIEDSDAWSGAVYLADGEAEPFHGWIEFMALMDDLRHPGRRIQWSVSGHRD